MGQMNTFTWDRPLAGSIFEFRIGYEPVRVWIFDHTQGEFFFWVKGMDQGSVFQVDNPCAYSATNGITIVSDDPYFGAEIFSASDSFTTQSGDVYLFTDLQVGDKISVTDVTESGAGTSWNGIYTVSAFGTSNIEVTESLAGKKTYVSGGYIVPIQKADGTPIPVQAYGGYTLQIGTNAQGVGTDSVLSAIIESE